MHAVDYRKLRPLVPPQRTALRHMRALYSSCSRLDATTFHALRCSSSLLGAHVNKALARQSPVCRCRCRCETTAHFLLTCALHRRARAVLAAALHRRRLPLDVATMLLADGAASMRDADTRAAVFTAVASFCRATARFA